MAELDMNRIPEHIAIICDGNGRWAKKRLQPRTMGHRKGGFNIRDIARSCNKLGIKYVTFFCFSTENWNRPKKEVEYLMTAPLKFINRFKKDILNGETQIRLIGRKDRLSKEFLDTFKELEEKTKDHKGTVVSLCVDYGSYDEITTAIKEIAKEYKDNKITLDDINENLVNDHLFTKGYPKLDLLFRTSVNYSLLYTNKKRAGICLFFLILLLSFSQTILMTSCFLVFVFAGQSVLNTKKSNISYAAI